jgi:hypothetical protein
MKCVNDSFSTPTLLHPRLAHLLVLQQLLLLHLIPAHQQHTRPWPQELFDEAVDRAVKRYPLMLLTAPAQAAAGYK